METWPIGCAVVGHERAHRCRAFLQRPWLSTGRKHLHWALLELREMMRRVAKVRTESARLTAIALWAFADADGFCWPSDASIAELTGLAPRSIYAARKELIREGLVAQETHGAGRANKYQLFPNHADGQGVGSVPAEWEEAQYPAAQRGEKGSGQALADRTSPSSRSGGVSPRAAADETPRDTSVPQAQNPAAARAEVEVPIEVPIEVPNEEPNSSREFSDHLRACDPTTAVLTKPPLPAETPGWVEGMAAVRELLRRAGK
jgi:hypothetical protein